MASGKIDPELQLVMANALYRHFLYDDLPAVIQERPPLERIVEQFCEKGIFVVRRQVKCDPAAAGTAIQRRQQDLFRRSLVTAEFRPATNPQSQRECISYIVQCSDTYRQRI